MRENLEVVAEPEGSGRLRATFAVITGAVAIAIVAAIALTLIVANGAGNGGQLGTIAFGPILVVGAVAGLLIGVCTAGVSQALGVIASISKKPSVILLAAALGGGLGAIPVSIWIASFLGWPAISALGIVSIAAIGAGLAWFVFAMPKKVGAPN